MKKHAAIFLWWRLQCKKINCNCSLWDIAIIMAGGFFCLRERRITQSLLPWLQSWIRIERLSSRGAGGYPHNMTRMSSEGPEKHVTHVREKSNVCTAAVGSLGLLTSVALCAPSFLTQLPLLILAAFDILFQRRALQSSGLSSPQDADIHACSEAQRLYPHTYICFFPPLCFINEPLYLPTKQQHTSWCTSPW